MTPLDRLLSLVRPGDTINLSITGTDNGSQIVVAARLKNHVFDPDDTSATNNLVRELTYPHLVTVSPDQSVTSALDAALDSLSGAQSVGLDALNELDLASSRIREAAAASKSKAGAKKVTVTNDGSAAHASAGDTTQTEDRTDATPATAKEAPSSEPSETPASSFFDPT